MSAMEPGSTVLVTGGGGFIGGHLVASLARDGFAVRSVDIKPLEQWYQVTEGVENISADVSLLDEARQAADGQRYVFNLAADMGGMGFIENNKAACMLSVLTTTHVLMAAKEAGASGFFYSSSACVYAADKQISPEVTALAEADAYPAMPEDGYGWEKLFSERMCRHYLEDFGFETRVARYHNVYGPNGTWDGGREKAPAAVAARWQKPSALVDTRSRSGATASRPAASCTSTTVSTAPEPCSSPTSSTPSTSAHRSS